MQLLKIPLGSVIGSKQFSENYILSLINKWCGEITELFLTAKTHPEAAYSAFISGDKQYHFYVNYAVWESSVL